MIMKDKRAKSARDYTWHHGILTLPLAWDSCGVVSDSARNSPSPPAGSLGVPVKKRGKTQMRRPKSIKRGRVNSSSLSRGNGGVG